jgi:ketosteroid isomerase-like protein
MAVADTFDRVLNWLTAAAGPSSVSIQAVLHLLLLLDIHSPLRYRHEPMIRYTALLALITCVQWSPVAWAGLDEDAIEMILLAEAKSSEAFAETRDTQAVLKLYTTDYSGVQDGVAETRETIEKWLSEYGSELDKGSRVHFLGAISNLITHVAGSAAWATYDYVFQAIRSGELDAQERGKCTSVLRKEASGWLIQHEHCSKTKPQGMERYGG